MRSCDVLPKAEDVNSSFPKGRLEGVLDEIDGSALDLFCFILLRMSPISGVSQTLQPPRWWKSANKNGDYTEISTYVFGSDRRPSAVGLKAPLVLS